MKSLLELWEVWKVMVLEKEQEMIVLLVMDLLE